MNAIEMLVQQLETVSVRFHHVASAVTPDLMTASAGPRSNPVGFLLWHIARGQDWSVHTAVRGVPELVRSTPWSTMRGLSTPGIGTGFARADAGELAGRLHLLDSCVTRTR